MRLVNIFQCNNMNTKSQNTILNSRNIFLLIAATSFLVLYYPIFIELVAHWNEDANYSHGFFIPLMAGFMAWIRRDELQKASKKPMNIALVLVVLGLAQFIVAWVGSEYFLQRTSMILVLLGTVTFLWGARVGLIMLLPIVYLIFMIPLPAIIWNKLAFPLSLFASKIAAEAGGSMGLSILREGNILILPNITLQVVEACSGLRSLTTLLALGAFLAFISSLGVGKKWFLFLAAVPVALLSNVIRLTATVYMADHFGAAAAEGFIHEFSGWVVFVVGLAMLLLVQSGLAWLER